jgi:histidinol-phosphate aminotransferase
MSSLLDLARPDIIGIKAYSHAAWLPSMTRLHANEVPWRPAGDATAGGLNRYPEPQPVALLERLAQLYGVPAASILVTRGSDEAIDVLSRIFLRPGSDSILQCTPSFGMYRVAAHIQGAGVVEVALDRERNWELDADRMLDAWRPGVKLVYLCSPNNPTGNSFALPVLERVCGALDRKAVVVIDEAYIEWSARASLTAWLGRFSTIAVLRTLSKAYALAGARIGALIAQPELIELARRIVPPYSLAQPTIEAALAALRADEVAATHARVQALLTEREYLRERLLTARTVTRVWPSDANFLLIDSGDPDAFLRASMAGGTIVRDLRSNPALPNSFRITVGTRAQNDALLSSLEAIR